MPTVTKSPHIKNKRTNRKSAVVVRRKKEKIHRGKKAPFPTNLTPMLATLVDKPFDHDDWLYEVKWDGYRALAFLNKGKVELRSRNNKSFNEKILSSLYNTKGTKVECGVGWRDHSDR